MHKLISGIVTLSIALFTAAPLRADHITLKNGDRLSGTIVKQTEEGVVIETEYAGVVKIAAAMVKTVTVVSLEKGPTGPNAEAEATGAKTPAEQPKGLEPLPRLFGGRYFGVFDGWAGNANIGFSYSSGNSETKTMTTGIRAVKTGADDKLTVYARSVWHSSRNSGTMQTTSNAVWGGARYDRNINDRVFGFGSYDFERDRPKKLHFRSIAGGGLGHHTIKNENTELDVLVGGAWNRTWQVGNNSDTPEALAGTSFKHRFNGRLKLQETFTFFQNVTDKAEYRFVFDSTVSADVTKRVGVFLTFGNRFNNDPLIGAEKNDFLFTTGMKWNFGKPGK